MKQFFFLLFSLSFSFCIAQENVQVNNYNPSPQNIYQTHEIANSYQLANVQSRGAYHNDIPPQQVQRAYQYAQANSTPSGNQIKPNISFDNLKLGATSESERSQVRKKKKLRKAMLKVSRYAMRVFGGNNRRSGVSLSCFKF